MTTLRLLKNGSEAFPALFSALDRAEAFIAVEMYIVEDDATGGEFRDHLAAAAGRGVRVRVLIDAWGCLNLADSFWNALLDNGGEVKRFHPLSKGLFPFRNHRKLVLIDDHIAFMGGMNVADVYYRGVPPDLPWRDNMLMIEGREAAGLKQSFSGMWAISDSPFRGLLHRFRADQWFSRRSSHAAVQFLENGPENPFRPVRRAYRRIVQQAKQSIDLSMGYFYPHGSMLRALKRAARRGVRVRLLSPLHTDVPISRWAARGLYGRLLRAGVEVWEYEPAMMHAKLAIADNAVICGSANLDLRSGKINYELVALVRDAPLAERARADFEEDLRSSVRITLEDWRKRPLIEKFKERVSYCLLARFDLIVSRRELAKRIRIHHFLRGRMRANGRKP
jgi:cardiolipin synthase